MIVTANIGRVNQSHGNKFNPCYMDIGFLESDQIKKMSRIEETLDRI